MQPLRIGIVGAGNISGIYLENFKLFPSTEVVAIADLDQKRAAEVAEKNGVPNVLTTEQLLAHPDVDLVLNITIPKAHAEVALMAVEAGKHVYNEKPLTIEKADARKLLDLAKAKGVRVGCAPDTFLGSGHQTVRDLIDQGAVGTPVAVQGFMVYPGPEAWHPSPHFFYKHGAGPLFDMGPYYLTAFVNMFGPIKRVSSCARITHAQRTIGSEPFKGEKIEVEVDTYIGATMQFANGVVGQLTTTFDAHGFPHQPNIVIFGSEATMIVPDPNQFNAPITIKRGGGEPEVIEVTKPFGKNSRGLGILDIAFAEAEGRAHRASGELAYHVLDAMTSIIQSSREDRHIHLETQPERPATIGESEFPAERDLLVK